MLEPKQIETDDVIVQIGAKAGGNRLGDFEGRKLDGALSDRVAHQRRGGDRARRSAVKKPLHLPIPYHAIEQAGPAGALAGAEHGPHQRKGAGGLNQQPARTIGHALLVQFRQSPLEIVVHQRDSEVRRALDDANAEFAQGGAERRRTVHVDRLNTHPAIFQILLGHSGRQAEARPVTLHGATGRTRRWNDIAPLNQPLEGFLDLVGRKIFRQFAGEFAESSCGPSRSRTPARNRVRREERTSGPRNRDRRHPVAARRR